jgi:hypothetical protein
MGDAPNSPPQSADWFEPGRYSVWAYLRDDERDEPILFAAYEWEDAGLRAIRVDCVWLHEEEQESNWEDHPEFSNISRGIEAAVFARMVTSGKVIRIGAMPAIRRYAEPPSFLAT